MQHKFTSRQYLRMDAGYYNQPSYNYRTPASTATLFGGQGNYNDRASRNYHGHVQYNWALPRRHNFVFGTETRHEMANNNVFNTSNWLISNGKEAQNYYAIGRTINQAAYAQDTISITEHFQIVAGGRYDYWKTYEGEVNSYTAAAPFTKFPERTTNSITGKLAAVYSAPHDWTFRASIGSAFRNPGIYELYSTSIISGILYESNPALKSERLKSWEAGLRKSFGQRFNVDAAYFENYIDDLIYRKTITPTDRINVNAGAGRTRGVELSGRESLTRWLQLRGTYTYTDSILTSNPAAPLSVGKRTPFIPAQMASGQLLAFYRKWTGSATARYVGRVFSSDTNADTTKGVMGAYDPYFVMDATLGYQATRHLQVFGSAENLAGRRFYLFYLNPGRTVYAGVRIKL